VHQLSLDGSISPVYSWTALEQQPPCSRRMVCDGLQVDMLAGLLVVGHKQGEARVYQFSQEEQEVSCVDLDGKHPAEHHGRQQPPGFQCILQCTHHAASISSIAIASRLKLVGLADENGAVSLLELTRVSSSHALPCAMLLTVLDHLCRVIMGWHLLFVAHARHHTVDMSRA